MGPSERLKRHLTSENLWLYILSLASKKPVYAYAMRKEIKRFGFEPSLVMLYLVLPRLELAGYIRSEMRGRRKYYIITKKGKEELEKGKSEMRRVLGLL
ncbi:MAG: PadR family transcriptional regulator [Candidatus Anstonellales archaeon]